jgi:integrase/recombinase XerD
MTNINETQTTNTTNPLTQYIQHLQQQNKSDNTIKSYCKDINLFFEYFNLNNSNTTINTTPPIITITRDQILQYKQYLQNTKNNNAKSINRSLSSLKSYNEFLVLQKYQENMVILSMDYIKVQEPFSSPTNVTPREVKNFMDKIKKNEPFRNYAITTLIANTGLRISEALNIKINGLTLNDNEMIIIGKGNKQRIIILNPTAIEVIKEYITNHRHKSSYADKCEYLFISNKGGKLEPCTIERIFNKYSNKITPHSLRHCYATGVLENEVLDLRQLQQQLGHSRLDTVQIYTHPTKEKMKQKLNGFKIG